MFASTNFVTVNCMLYHIRIGIASHRIASPHIVYSLLVALSGYIYVVVCLFQVKFTQRRPSFSHFLVQICAIIGGVFTVLGIVNSIALGVGKKFKSDIGKLG